MNENQTMGAALAEAGLRTCVNRLVEMVADYVPSSTLEVEAEQARDVALAHVMRLRDVIDAQTSEILKLEEEITRLEGAEERAGAVEAVARRDDWVEESLRSALDRALDREEAAQAREAKLTSALAGSVKTIGELVHALASIGRA